MGWSWPSQSNAIQDKYSVSPDFISSGSGSDGLLIRQTGTSPVYLIENGKRRHIQSTEALNWMGNNWDPDVMDVSSTIITNHVPNTGNYIYAAGEGETNSTIKESFKSAYSTNAGDTNCVKPSSWKGWPGTFSNCLRFPIGQVTTASNSGASGTTGKYQKFGSDSGEAGAINYSSKGTYAVYGALYNKYKELGYSASSLGFTTSNEYSWNGYRRSDFEGGYIYWNPSTNSTSVVYNNTDTTPPSAPKNLR